jgi:hypothetical protein
MSELKKQTFDIVILSAVLEHISDPLAILWKIHGILSQNGYLRLEVPYESFYYRNWFGDSFTQKYLNLLAHSLNKVMKFGSVEFLNENKRRQRRDHSWDVVEDDFDLNFLDLESVFASFERFPELSFYVGEYSLDFISLMIFFLVKRLSDLFSIVSGYPFSFSVSDGDEGAGAHGILD